MTPNSQKVLEVGMMSLPSRSQQHPQQSQVRQPLQGPKDRKEEGRNYWRRCSRAIILSVGRQVL